MHTANLYHSTIYAIGTFGTLIQYTLAKFFNRKISPFIPRPSYNCKLCKQKSAHFITKIKDKVSNELFSIIYCNTCKIAFTEPQPKKMDTYYPETYFSKIKSIIYDIIQQRRIAYITQHLSSGKIIDIGCGEGLIATHLDYKKYEYLGIETSFSKISVPYIRLGGIEEVHEENEFSMITFWQSFEHLHNPKDVIRKSYQLLKKNGYIIIEIPNFSSFERQFFRRNWFHYDPPRHLFHYSFNGLAEIIESGGFKVLEQKKIYASEYIPIGFSQSLLSLINYQKNLFSSQKFSFSFFLTAFLSVSLLIISIPLSLFIYIFLNESPIQILIAKKT